MQSKIGEATDIWRHSDDSADKSLNGNHLRNPFNLGIGQHLVEQ
jgi:hypothetical protein